MNPKLYLLSWGSLMLCVEMGTKTLSKLVTAHLPNAHTHVCQHDYTDVIMSTMASQITAVSIAYSTVFFRRRSKKTSKFRDTGLCERNSPVIREYPAQGASRPNARNAFIWWRHHGDSKYHINGCGYLSFIANSAPILCIAWHYVM